MPGMWFRISAAFLTLSISNFEYDITGYITACLSKRLKNGGVESMSDENFTTDYFLDHVFVNRSDRKPPGFPMID